MYVCVCCFLGAYYILGTVSGMLRGLLCTSQDSQLQTIETMSGKTKQKGLCWKAIGWLTEMTGRLES